MDLSILDLAPVSEGSDAATSIRNSVRLAQAAETQGYRRYWLAEHHNMPHIASSATAVMIQHIAAATENLRVGAGAIGADADQLLHIGVGREGLAGGGGGEAEGGEDMAGAVAGRRAGHRSARRARHRPAPRSPRSSRGRPAVSRRRVRHPSCGRRGGGRTRVGRCRRRRSERPGHAGPPERLRTRPRVLPRCETAGDGHRRCASRVAGRCAPAGAGRVRSGRGADG